MDLVLGVSMTPTTVRMVLVEGEKADGVMVDHHVFPITASDGAAPSSASDQVMDAVLATRQCALAAGHHLVSTGVTLSEHAEAAALRQALTACGIDDVTVFSGLDAAGALARAVGSAVGYDTGALMFIERDTATLSVVQTIDGSVAKVLGRSLHSPDAMAVLTEMVNGLETHEPRPEAVSVVASGVDVGAVKSHLENRVSLPVSAPGEPELALALGAAALAAANAPHLDAPTFGLACSREPAVTAVTAYPVALAGPSQLAPAGHDGASLDVAADIVPGRYNAVAGHGPFLSAGSSVTATFAVGVLALAISFAVLLTAAQHLSPGPNTAAPAPLAARPAPEAIPAPAPPVPPPVVPAVGPPLTALQTSRSATALYMVPPPPAMPPHASAPVARPAAPAPVGIPPAILPAPWLLPIPPPPHYQPPVFGPWYPAPRQPQPQRPQHGHGHHGRDDGGD